MTKKLIAKRARLWAKALEENSGSEARNFFRKGSRRCCLCVAADVAAEETKDKSYKVADESNMPLGKVGEWFGWGSNDPKLGYYFASGFNDWIQLDHKDIAKLVRKEFCK